MYRLLRFLFIMLGTIFGRWTVTGIENIPEKGPLLVVCNHVSYWDPILLGCTIPRQIHFMAKAQLFNYPVLGPIVRALGAFPIKRGRSDRNALRHAIHLLEEGKVLGVFPEGTRSRTGNLQPFKPGITMLAYKAKCPILPVALINSRKFFFGWVTRIEVRIGKPLNFPRMERRPSAEVLDEMTEQSREAVKLLLGA